MTPRRLSLLALAALVVVAAEAPALAAPQLTAPQELLVCNDLKLMRADNATEKTALANAKSLACPTSTPVTPPAPPPPPVTPPPVTPPTPVPPSPPPVSVPVTGQKVSSLKALGSFNVPVVGSTDAAGFAYGGQAVSFNPANQSLFLAGFNAPPSGGQRVGELKIPAYGATATVLQAPADPAAGNAGKVGPNSVLVGGTLPWNGNLVFTEYLYYDGANVQTLTHFSRPLTLASGAVTGPYRVGSLEGGLYSGYLGVVDPAWVSALGGPALTGNADLGVISRTSYGPAAFTFDPSSTSQTAKPLVYYDDAHQSLGPWSGANATYGGADTVKGVVMPVGTGTVLFVGTHGATFCYGPGTSDKTKAGQIDPSVDPLDAFCYDPDSDSKGVHGYPYTATAWLYDAADLANVVAGHASPWTVKPYAVLTIPGMGYNVGGAGYDPATGRIFIAESLGNGTLPVVHVYVAQ